MKPWISASIRSLMGVRLLEKNVLHSQRGISTVKRYGWRHVHCPHIVDKFLPIRLDWERRGIFHMLQHGIEEFSRLLNEVLEVPLERAIKGGDDRQFGVIFEKNKTREMDGADLGESHCDSWVDLIQ